MQSESNPSRPDLAGQGWRPVTGQSPDSCRHDGIIPRSSTLRLSAVSRSIGWKVLQLVCLIMCGSFCGESVSAAEPVSTSPASIFPMTKFEGDGNLLLDASFPGEKWVFFSGRKDASINETWKMTQDAETKSPILICLGEPHGYLRTRAAYENFDLHLEWRFPRDPDGNSGILLFTTGEDRVWPSALQLQLHQPELGVVFPIGGAKSTNELRPTEKLAKPVNQWNQCEIQCRHGTASVTVNGQSLGEVSGCLPVAGTIALQSEGSEIHFRSIWIREVPLAQAEVPNASKDSAIGIDLQRQ